jgi:hypothetical protein
LIIVAPLLTLGVLHEIRFEVLAIE